MKRILAMLLAAMLVLSMGVVAFALNVADWKTGDGVYGSVVDNGDGTLTFKGAEELDADNNAHTGPYTMANAKSIANGEVVDSLDIYLDPNEEGATKAAFSVSINDTDGNYATETLVNLTWNAGKILVQVGLDSDYAGEITEAGIYTLKWRYFDSEGALKVQFILEKDGTEKSKTAEIDLNKETAGIGARGYIWFVDISVANGLVIGRPNPVEEPEEEPVVRPDPCDHKLDANGKCSKCGVVIISYTDGKPADKVEEANPNTGAESVVGVVAAIAAVALAGAFVSKK